MPNETPLAPSLPHALRTCLALLDGSAPRRGADGERLPWTLSPDAMLGLAYLTMRIDGETGHAPRAYPPPLAGEGDDAWARYVSSVQRWQLERDGHLTGFFGSDDELRAAADAGFVATHAAVFVRRAGSLRFTTPGRSQVVQAIGDATLGERFDRSLTAPRIDEGLTAIAGQCGTWAAWTARVRLERLGLDAATRSGLSIGIDTLPKREGSDIIERAANRVAGLKEQLDEGLITDGERSCATVAYWQHAVELIVHGLRQRMARQSGDPFEQAHALAMLLREESARHTTVVERLLATRQISVAHLLGGRQIINQWRETHEVPVLENLRDGLGSHGFFRAAMMARGEQLGEMRHDRWARSMRDLLRRAIGKVRVVAVDCGSLRPLWAPLGPRERTGMPVAERVVGRTLAGSLRWPGGGVDGAIIERTQRERWLAEGLLRVPVRSVVTCEARGGVCAACLGRDPEWRPEVGDPVGRWAVEALSESVRTLARQRHPVMIVAGASGRAAISAASDGLVAIESRDDDSLMIDSDGHLVALDDRVQVELLDRQGQPAQKHFLQRGDVLLAREGEFVREGTVLVQRDAMDREVLMLARSAGTVRWRHVETCEVMDDILQQSRLTVTRSPMFHEPPRLVIEREGREELVGWLDSGAVLLCHDGQQVRPGDRLAVIASDPRSRWHDPFHDPGELWPLLRGRGAHAEAILSEVDGRVSLVIDRTDSQRVTAVAVTPADAAGRPLSSRTHWHDIPRGKVMFPVHEGDLLRAGCPLTHGAISPQHVLRFEGAIEAATWLVDRLLALLAQYDATPRSAYAELVVRSMLAGRIIDPGDTSWGRGDVVEWPEFFAHNGAVEAAGKRPAQAEPVVRNLARAGQSRRPPDRRA